MKRLLLLALAAAMLLAANSSVAASPDPAVVTVYPVEHPTGLMVTSGGWAYCLEVQALAKRFGYTLLCGRYYLDRYTGYGLRKQRSLDWGKSDYLASLAAKAEALHRRVGGRLVLIGVSYSGFGVATLASHHPELRPDRLIVIDSFLDLAARRVAAGPKGTGAEIDAATDSGAPAAVVAQTVSVPGLAQIVGAGTRLTVIWSVSAAEQREFNGATCDVNANAADLAALSDRLHRPVLAWVTRSQHGHDLWDSGRRIMAGHNPGREVVFRPGGGVPPGATCG